MRGMIGLARLKLLQGNCDPLRYTVSPNGMFWKKHECCVSYTISLSGSYVGSFAVVNDGRKIDLLDFVPDDNLLQSLCVRIKEFGREDTEVICL
jgi:hypothetical protein